MAATVGLVKLFGKTIPVPVEVDMRLEPFKETGGGWGAVRGGEDKDEDSAKDNQVPEVESSEEGESQSFSSSALRRSIADNGGKSKKPPKPEKILPCPRCDSMATKFCYYNNYNLNQPRHFCKNCQRYWTAGGSMRNVPVGAGRRRNKNCGALFRHINVVKGPFHTEEKPNSASGDGSINVSPWAYPFSFYPMTGFLSVPCTLPSSPPAVAESEKRLWFPKTLRIDDPAEAAKSSIWATMGFSKDVAGRGGLFNGFDQHKVNHSSAMAEGPKVFHANPAAVSRSFCFQKNAILE